MTGTARTDALLRDIAKLFVTYPASVWRPVLQELQTGGDSQRAVADAIAMLIATSETARSRPLKRAKPKAKSPAAKRVAADALPLFSEGRVEILTSLRTDLNNRDLLPSASALRGFYLAIGGKAVLPSNRGAAVLDVLRHLDSLAEDRFREAFAYIRNMPRPEGQRDYGRWFELIRPGP